MKTKLKLAAIAIALVTTVPAMPAFAHGGGNYNAPRGNYVNRNVVVNNTYVNRVGYNGGYRGGYYGGYRGGNGWGYAGAAIAGAIIGGAIANSYSQPYYAPAPVYVAPPVQYAPPVYVAPQQFQPVPPSWHWEQQYDAACNCMRNIQVMD